MVNIDLIDLYRNEIRILGSDSRKLDVADSARLLELINPYFESKAFRPLPISRPVRWQVVRCQQTYDACRGPTSPRRHLSVTSPT